MGKNIKNNNNLKQNHLNFIFLIIFCLVFIFLITSAYKIKGNKNLSSQIKEQNNLIDNCPVIVKEEIVRGVSMEPVLKEGQTIKVLYGYYQCHPVLREDIILYDYKGNPYPLVKRVKGIEGDTFHLEKTQSGWLIMINGEVLKNSNNEPYLLSGSRYKLLSLYERDYQGKIPKGAYLILGEIPSGSLDSTFFGFIGKDDILGKVEF